VTVSSDKTFVGIDLLSCRQNVILIAGFLFAIGFVSILSQTVLLRELNVAFYGVELIYTLAIGIWLLCSACGAILGRRDKQPSLVGIHLLFWLLAISIPVDVAFIRYVRLLFSDIPGGYLPLHTQILAVSVSLLPGGLLLGLLFQWAAKAYVAKENSLATAYAIECLGGLAGGICATLLLKFGCRNFFIALLCALAAAAISFPVFHTGGARWLRAAAVALAAILIPLAFKTSSIDRFMTSWTHPDLVRTQDTPYSRITVVSRQGQTSIFENDSLLFDTESTRAEEFVHLAALQHENPQKVLILGGGIEGTIREVLQHSPESVDYVEQNPALIDIIAPSLPPYLRNSLRAPNVHIIHADPRRFLKKASRYDLILIGMPEPASGQANRFYTQEFFRQCYSRLKARGVVAFSLQSSENLWTPQLTRRMVSIYRAARSAFPEILFIPGTTNVVIGSGSKLTKDPSLLAARLKARGIQARIVSANFLRYVFTNDRLHEIAQTLESGNAPINSDARPICYQYTLMIWLSKFIPSHKLPDLQIPDLSNSSKALWVIAIVLPAILLMRTSWSIRRAILTAISGFAGMVLETILILHYQIKNGILFQDIGILLTGFMAGLAFGAYVMTRTKRLLSRGAALAVLLAFAAVCAAVGLQISSGQDAALLKILVFLVLSGFFVACLFAYASLRADADQMVAVSPLYAADLVGGCIGSIVASLFLAPLAGLAWTAYWMIPVAILSALLL
jgi:spermidine synthase